MHHATFFPTLGPRRVLMQKMPAFLQLVLVKTYHETKVLSGNDKPPLNLLRIHFGVVKSYIEGAEVRTWWTAHNPIGLVSYHVLLCLSSVSTEVEVPWLAVGLAGSQVKSVQPFNIQIASFTLSCFDNMASAIYFYKVGRALMTRRATF